MYARGIYRISEYISLRNKGYIKSDDTICIQVEHMISSTELQTGTKTDDSVYLRIAT